MKLTLMKAKYLWRGQLAITDGIIVQCQEIRGTMVHCIVFASMPAKIFLLDTEQPVFHFDAQINDTKEEDVL